MLKKTSASIGLIIATAAGILLSGAPAQAQSNSVFGCCSSFHSRHHSSNRNHNRTRPRIFIRIFIYNKNNNAAVARNGARQRSSQFQRERFRRRELRRPIWGPQDQRGRGEIAPVPLAGPPRNQPIPVTDPARVVPQSATRTFPPGRVNPRDNGQISRNGVVHPVQGSDAQQSRPGAEEAGQNGIQANPGTDQTNPDINAWLNQALS